MTFAPHLEILPPSQRVLWDELETMPSRYVLYGGTALALRLGHRQSIDFDFFSHDAVDRAELAELPWLHGATTIQEAPNTRTVLIERAGGTVKVSLFGAIQFGRVGTPDTIGRGLKIASLLDLGGTKIKALLQRVEAKDYLDVDAMLTAQIPLPAILGSARALFGAAFNPLIARKALTYFEGGDLDTLSAEVKSRLTSAATAGLETFDVPKIAARLD